VNLRIFIPLIFLLLVGSTAFAQDPQLATGDPTQFPQVQTIGSQPQDLNIQGAQSGATGRPDVLNPPAEFVAPPTKKADDNPGDAPLLVPIPPAEEVPFNTAEYRNNKIPWEQFLTAAIEAAR